MYSGEKFTTVHFSVATKQCYVKPPGNRELLKHNVSHGPIQPVDGSVRNDGRCIRNDWYARYPWLEYSLKKQAAYCFVCRLFATRWCNRYGICHNRIRQLEKTLEKDRGFGKHCSSKCRLQSEKEFADYKRNKPVDAVLSEEVKRELSMRQASI